MEQQFIRNFSIIAHIDHGKSTLADRILEKTGAVTKREMKEQLLDDMDIERERGITIKARSVTLDYKANDGQTYQFNFIDTPGHVDFTYEVSRSLAACDGALLVVDATQGVEAQTLVNTYLALDNDLEIIPVMNKADLPSAEPERIRKQIEDVIGLDTEHTLLVSAKTGMNVDLLLEQIVEFVPPPTGDRSAPLEALVFDCYFDPYRGVVAVIQLKSGSVKKGDKILLMRHEKEYEVTDIGIFSPKMESTGELQCGEVGYLIAAIKTIQDVSVGETITLAKNPAANPLPGFKPVQPMVFAGIYPIDPNQYGPLRDSLLKLQLNDAALEFVPENSMALGFGFRCGFLGLLHMNIVQERLEREFDLDLITTPPGVEYKVHMNNDEIKIITSPALMPVPSEYMSLQEPMADATIITDAQYVGNIIKLCETKRGLQQSMDYISETRMIIKYHLPLGEIILDFFDKLKSVTRGYASLDYQMIEPLEADMVLLDVLVNKELVDALSLIVHRSKAEERGRQLVESMKELIPRQQFDIAIQATIGTKIIARSTVKALRKDVTAKCYGGDITRKRKLLEKQKKGKKRMKSIGNVEIPSQAFLAILKVKD